MKSFFSEQILVIFFSLVVTFYSNGLVFSQSPNLAKNQKLLNIIKKNTSRSIIQPDYIPKKSGHYTKVDWAAIIDATWGAGLPTAQKLAIFDNAWNEVNSRYAAFQNLDVDWDSLKNVYRPEIENGVSRGRFAAIMNHLAFALKEAHTFIADMPVNWGTALNPGVPLFVIGAWRDNAHFGACLTPLPDSSLLVYRALPNHSLGLEVGDIVLGYDGIPWKKLYKELLEVQLPIHITWVWGSTDNSITHQILASAGMNWHLYDTIDIAKYSTGDTVHLSTTQLRYQNGLIWGNEQLEIPGVPMPNIPANDFVSWGIVEGTQIGYVYVASCEYDPQNTISGQFYNAIHSLMFNHQTTGLILDFRLNYGGTIITDAGFSLLFDSIIQTAGIAVRNDPNDHFNMGRLPWPIDLMTIHGNPATFYDRPISVLVGPGAISAGDWEPFRASFHPNVRFFGKPTSGSFSAGDYPDLGNPDWFMYLTYGNGYLMSDPEYYLTHRDIHIDEKIWLTREDVVKGKDTVVEAAIAWINDSTTIDDLNSQQQPLNFELFNNYPNPFNPTTTIRFELPHPAQVSLKIYNIQGKLVRSLLTDQFKTNGSHSVVWDGKNEQEVEVGSGEYFYRVETDEFCDVKKMLLVR